MKYIFYFSCVVISLLYGSENIFIEDFVIIGNKKIDKTILLESVQEYKHKSLDADTIHMVANKITNKYQSLGYEKTRAYIPIQDVQKGILKIIITTDNQVQANELKMLVINGYKLEYSKQMNIQDHSEPVVIKENINTPVSQSINYPQFAPLFQSVTDESQLNFIQKIIEEAVLKSPAVLSKDNALQAAISSEDAAKWQYFPTPSVSLEQGDSGQTLTVAKIQQPLWAGGRIDAEYDKAKKLSEIAKMSLEEIKQTLAVYTCEAIYSVLSAYGHVLVYQDAVARLENHQAMIIRRVNHGISPDSELFLLNTRLVQAKTDLSMAFASLDKALSLLSQRLARTITLDELTPILPKRTCEATLPIPYQNVQFLQTVLASHPGVTRYQQQIESASYDIEIKKSSLFPTVYAKVEKQWDSSKDVDTKTSFVLGVQYTPGAGFSTLSAVEVARANFLVAQQEKENFLLELKQKIASEMSDYTFTVQRYQNYVTAVETTQKTAESYDRLFIAGKRSWLDVMNAEREWSTAQISLSDVQAYLMITPLKLQVYASELYWQKGLK